MAAGDGITEAWSKVNRANTGFFRPYAVTWLSLMLTCLAAHLYGAPSASLERANRVISIPKLERVLRITMTLSIVGWATMVWLVGGFAEFAVSHWYLPNLALAHPFRRTLTPSAHLSPPNPLL